jgi:hypothetical protein
VSREGVPEKDSNSSMGRLHRWIVNEVQNWMVHQLLIKTKTYCHLKMHL